MKHTPLDDINVGWSCISQLNPITNSKLAIFGLCHLHSVSGKTFVLIKQCAQKILKANNTDNARLIIPVESYLYTTCDEQTKTIFYA